MNRFNRLTVFLSLVAAATVLSAADKKPLPHDVYDRWKSIGRSVISNNGQWVLYTIDPQEGDANLVITNLQTGRQDTVARGSRPQISYDSRYAAFVIKPFFADVKKAKVAKKKADDMPKDSIGIVRLGADSVVRIARVKSFTLPEKGAGWIAIHLEKEPAKSDTTRKKTGTGDGADAEDSDKEKKDDQGSTLLLYRLHDGKEFRYAQVTTFAVSKNGNAILFAVGAKDSTVTPGVYRFDTQIATVDTLVRGKGSYKQLAWDEDGVQAAFLADRDTSKAKQRYFALCYWRPGMDSSTVLADTSVRGLDHGWLISEYRAPDFSKDGGRLFFGTAPVPLPEDTTLNDEETAKLDVWNWQDEYLQTHQLKQLDEEKKRSYLAVIELASRRFIQLATLAVPSIVVGNEGQADIALGLSDVPYRPLVSWEGVQYNDVYLVDLPTGTKARVMEKHKGGASLSPLAHWITWYDMKQRHWFTMNTATRTTAKVTRGITVPLYNELSDIPEDPGSYGLLGWTRNDSTLMIYDRYDIWSTDPAGHRAPYSLTAGIGRRTSTNYRYVRTDPEERFLEPDATLLLEVFDTKTKDTGFARLPLAGRSGPTILVKEAFDYSTPRKAKDDTTFIFQKNSFTVSPDLFVSGPSFLRPRRISDINPQQGEYLWGTAELVHWNGPGRKPLDGLLFKPENFDPKKKYPMLVYYYERMSDVLNRYFPPAPSASTINPTWCTSNGYLVFMPDIRYREGHPGQSAVDCIVPGVQKLIARGFVDPARIGLQGQSWGGYQTAFIITRTSMFRAAMAGAPVSNMTSAYGGIRWESGMSRMFQYERTQSRIGGTLWEKRDLYLENSPLFFADRVTTPLLIMHNDADGAVPWYQGIELFTALRRLHKPVWMLTYNNEAHNLVQRKNRKDLSVRMMQFFDHYLKGSPMPVWMSQGIPAVNKGKILGLELENP